MTENESKFVFVICQAGAEAATRKEILKLEGFNLAFSCPGFLTFKVDSKQVPDNFVLPVALARTYGFSLGKVIGENADELVQQILSHAETKTCSAIHVYERETLIPGQQRFEPGISMLAKEVASRFESHIKKDTPDRVVSINRVAKIDERVMDVVLVKPNEWWFGYHLASTKPGRWPGGVPLMDTSTERASRAYYKLKEALLWSGIHISEGDVCAEIGSAPGGACELLLEMDAKVIAIDPAEMAPEVEKHENLTWIRRRGHEVRKKDFKDVRWLTADLSIAPQYTIDTVRDIVSHEKVNVSGVVLTLKMTDWSTVEQIPDHMDQLRKMGFQLVKARQLAFNRREYCLVGVKDKFLLRSARKRPVKKPPRPRKKSTGPKLPTQE